MELYEENLNNKIGSGKGETQLKGIMNYATYSKWMVIYQMMTKLDAGWM